MTCIRNQANNLTLKYAVIQDLTELAPYVSLAEKLGRLLVQLVTGGCGIKWGRIVYLTSRDIDDLDTRLMRAMIIKGIVEPISTSFVNLVNADLIAKQYGLRFSEERISLNNSPQLPVDSIRLQLCGVCSRFSSAIFDDGDIRVEGRVKNGIPHLSLIGSITVDVSLEGNLILCKQVDQPGLIGQVGTILAEQNVNINFMSVVRNALGKKAIMAIGIDEEPNKDALRKIGQVPSIEEFVFLKL